VSGIVAGLVQYAPGSGWWMRGWPAYSMHGWGLPFGSIVVALLFAGLVAAVVVLSVRLGRHDRRRTGEAIEIAKARYARGEISKNEFEQLKKDLS
jgi:putative membrane protein